MLKWRQAEAQKAKAQQSLSEIRRKEEEHLIKYRAERDARRMSGRFRNRNTEPRTKELSPEEVDGIPRINVILKGDVHGSVEAILDVLDTYTSHDKCRLNIVHYGVGDVTDGDIELAETFKAIIYAFSVDVPKSLKGLHNVSIKTCDIIYRLVDDLKEEIAKKLPPVEKEEFIGEANVLQKFYITEGKKSIPVAGCRCLKGVLKKASKFRLQRRDEVVYDGELIKCRV